MFAATDVTVEHGADAPAKILVTADLNVVIIYAGSVAFSAFPVEAQIYRVSLVIGFGKQEFWRIRKDSAVVFLPAVGYLDGA